MTRSRRRSATNGGAWSATATLVFAVTLLGLVYVVLDRSRAVEFEALQRRAALDQRRRAEALVGSLQHELLSPWRELTRVPSLAALEGLLADSRTLRAWFLRQGNRVVAPRSHRDLDHPFPLTAGLPGHPPDDLAAPLLRETRAFLSDSNGGNARAITDLHERLSESDGARVDVGLLRHIRDSIRWLMKRREDAGALAGDDRARWILADSRADAVDGSREWARGMLAHSRLFDADSAHFVVGADGLLAISLPVRIAGFLDSTTLVIAEEATAALARVGAVLPKGARLQAGPSGDHDVEWVPGQDTLGWFVSVDLDDIGDEVSEFNRRQFRLGLAVCLSAIGLVVSLVSYRRSFRRSRRVEQFRSELVANLSHELRTPATLLRIAAETLATEAPGSERAVHGLGVIVRESQRFGRLVDDLLVLSRGGCLRTEGAEVFDLTEVVTEVVASFQERWLETNMTGTLHAGETHSWVRGSPEGMAQVLSNLLDNAVRHAASGKAVEVRVRDDGVGHARIEVVDHGPGIPEEARDIVFERFRRLGRPLRPGEQGLGLGLAIAKAIVEDHRGTLDYGPTLGGGTTFTVVLPRATTSEER